MCYKCSTNMYEVYDPNNLFLMFFEFWITLLLLGMHAYRSMLPLSIFRKDKTLTLTLLNHPTVCLFYLFLPKCRIIVQEWSTQRKLKNKLFSVDFAVNFVHLSICNIMGPNLGELNVLTVTLSIHKIFCKVMFLHKYTVMTIK